MAYPDAVADRVLHELGIRDPKDLLLLEQIAFARGATVVDRTLRGMEARITILGKRAVISISDAVRNASRRRYSIAHELGHFEMHRIGSSLSLCTERDIIDSGTKISKCREQEANAFAASLLMPKQFFAPMCYNVDPTLDAVSELARIYSTSLTATGIRYTQFTREAAVLVFSQAGAVKWFSGSDAFNSLELFLPQGERLDKGMLASLYFRDYSVSAKPRHVPASAWLDSKQCRIGAKILEHSRPMHEHNGVLTMLWIDDDILDDDYYDQV